jgi:hypothetical protein
MVGVILWGVSSLANPLAHMRASRLVALNAFLAIGAGAAYAAALPYAGSPVSGCGWLRNLLVTAVGSWGCRL